MERTLRRREKKEKLAELDTKYASEIAQLEADGIIIKNKRVLARLFEKANGQVDVVKQLLKERQEKHHHNKEYRHKHRNQSQDIDETKSTSRKRREFSADDIDNLKRLRSAGIHGNPKKILEIFHQCNDSIDLTKARTEAEREERKRKNDERVAVRLNNSKFYETKIIYPLIII